MPFEKGHPKLGGKKLGTKNRDTLLKEERRAVFEAHISQKWVQIIDQLRPEYIADQYLGKAPEEINVNTKAIKINLSADLTDKLKQEMKRQLLNGDK